MMRRPGNGLRADAAAAGVNLHIRLSREEGRLTAEQIRAAVPEWQQASVWFCGPAAFGQDFAAGFPPAWAGRWPFSSGVV